MLNSLVRPEEKLINKSLSKNPIAHSVSLFANINSFFPKKFPGGGKKKESKKVMQAQTPIFIGVCGVRLNSLVYLDQVAHSTHLNQCTDCWDKIADQSSFKEKWVMAAHYFEGIAQHGGEDMTPGTCNQWDTLYPIRNQKKQEEVLALKPQGQYFIRHFFLQ